MMTLFGGLWQCGHEFAQPFWRTMLSEMAMAAPGARGRWRTLEALKQRFGNFRSDAIKNGSDANYWNAYTFFDAHIRSEFDELVQRGVLQQGAEVRCLNCGSFYWYEVERLQPRVSCLGCRASIALPTETEWSYRLNDLVANALRATGTLAVVQALYSLLHDTRGNMFLFLPCQEFAETFEGESRLELDLLALVKDRFIIGEVKSSPSGFGAEGLDRAVAIAEELGPDELVLAAPGEHWPPDVLTSIDDAKLKLATSGVTMRVLKMQWW
jgi:hypothetical protein